MINYRFPDASVHGRFQPLHNEHMEYILKAKEHCDFLWVGITMPETGIHSNPLGRERERPASNPLTYFERAKIIRGALQDSGIPSKSFECVPFPIETPVILPNFLPVTIPCLTTICEEWNREKVEVLKNCGYPVHILFERTRKLITGVNIRQLILDNDTSWEQLVPAAALKELKGLDIRTRLEGLKRRPIS